MKTIHNKAYLLLLELLRSKRLERGITQEKLASLLGVNQARISKIETHERRLDVIELRTICQVMNIPFLDFIKHLDETLTIKETSDDKIENN